MPPNVMRRLPVTASTGAWLLTLLSFTYALPSRFDISLRTRWKDIVTNLNFPRIDSSDSTYPLREIYWIHHIFENTPQNGNENKNYRQVDGDGLVNKFSYNLKSENGISMIKTQNMSTILKLHNIEELMAKKKQGERFSFQQSSESHSLPIFHSEINVSDLNSSLSTFPFPHKRHWGRSYTRNIFVHGKDDRMRIVPILLRKFPYYNMVRLSTGCTGTLVTPFHVLTAAHCVHDGKEFRNKLEMLKVEIPDTFGVRVYYIEKIGIPEKWLNPQSRTDRRAFFDFAVVRLSYGVHGRSKFLPLTVPSQEVLHEKLQFFGFPIDSLGLWRSVCSVKSNKALMDGNLILTRCNSAIGNSGAAVLAGDSRYGQKIVGVLSSTMPIGRTPFYSRYNIVTALTWSKLQNICAEIGRIGVENGVCPSSEKISKSRRFQHRNKVIPFFG